ncbi:cation efflux transporter [Flavobacterium saliperosum S13]|uniref:RND family efflux transporter, MFP subunit n=2 Tax=Flavobacterium saliperosum TaxID=329186 RepID=A0A1G4W0H3_9FLAO|nr:efflux RND transporter periplasmic adaptor subunit [Flavobacterium saliperosum]ESU27482.1 cation efflux transporter [Flavobacterium saliperosum S13]SCX14815.1 RND family efflux transporter, MFP subunit [Flavobacterium saliperosum]
MRTNNKILLLALLVLSLVSCNKKEDTKEDSSLEPLAYTLYTDNSELFVEFKPLVVGQTSKFAAHFTVLGENFKALTEANVTVSLVVGNEGIRNSADKPSSPGIFRLALMPKMAGKGTLIFDIKTKDFTDKIIIKDVTVYPNEKVALEQQPKHSDGGDISYLKEQAWKIDFANKAITKQEFHDVIKTSGQILAAPGDEMIVTAKASGVVLFSGKNTFVGTTVNNGNTLFTIAGGDITESNIDAAVKEAKANYMKTKADYERSKLLVADKIVSEKEHQQVKLQFENAQTAYNTVAKNYTSKGQNVLSPMSGYVKNVLVTEGQFVQSGTPLATISKNRNLIVQANVSQNYFNRLSSITSANFKTPQSDIVYNTKNLNGRIISYGKSASANAPFIPVTFEIDNQGQLISGSVVEVYLKSSSIPDALVVPVSALIEEQGTFYVYVQTEGESFQKREVKLGASDGQEVQLLSGIQENERVVTKGAYQIKLATASGTMPAHGHEH